MNNKKEAFNIISKLNFENLPVSESLTTTYEKFKDNNKMVDITWQIANSSTYFGVKEENGVKVLIFKVPASRFYTTDYKTFGADIKNASVQFEAEIIITDFKSDNVFFGINSSNSFLRFNIKNTFKNGLEILSGSSATVFKKVVFNYKFEANKKYNIVVTKEYNKYYIFIDGIIIGHCESDIVNSVISTLVNPTIVIGAKTHVSSAQTEDFTGGEMSNINISYGLNLKYYNSFTKYGDNLISRLNFGNLASLPIENSSYVCGLESVVNSNINWVYNTDNIQYGLNDTEYYNLNNTTFESDNIPNIHTLSFNIKNNGNIMNDVELLNLSDNYKIIYDCEVIFAKNEPKVEIIEGKTTSALDFENNLTDKVSSTTWNLGGMSGGIGTGEITSTNPLFGKKSFVADGLGHSLYTNTKAITGGSTPFTLEFYVLIKSGVSYNNFYDGTNNGLGSSGGILSQYRTGSDAEQNLSFYDKRLFFYRGTNGSTVPSIPSTYLKSKLSFNDINKYTISYDGSALRLFVNDKLDTVLGSTVGWDSNTDRPLKFLDVENVNNPNIRLGAKGIVDNVNIHNGIATKVRDYDEYEDNLIIDLQFDGQANSTNYIDNGKNKCVWNKIGTNLLVNNNKFRTGYSYLNKATNNAKIYTTDSSFSFVDDFTIEFEFMKSNAPEYCTFAEFNLDTTIDPKLKSYRIYMHSGSYSYLNAVGGRLLFCHGNALTEFKTQLESNPTSTENVLVSKQLIDTNKAYKVSIVRKNEYVYLYINGVLDNFIKFTNLNIETTNNTEIILGGLNGDNASNWFEGYINYFKMYEGVAITPNNKLNYTKLNFDGDLKDEYDNLVFTPSNITYDIYNSVKGSSLSLNGSNSVIQASNSTSLNFGSNNFIMEYDFRNKTFDSVNNRYLLGNSIALASGAFWRLFGTNTYKSGSLNFNFNGSNIGLTNTVEEVNNYYNEKLLRKDRVLIGIKNDVIVSSYIANINVDFSNLSIGTALNLTSGVSYFNGNVDNFSSYKDINSTRNETWIKIIVNYNNASYNNEFINDQSDHRTNKFSVLKTSFNASGVATLTDSGTYYIYENIIGEKFDLSCFNNWWTPDEMNVKIELLDASKNVLYILKFVSNKFLENHLYIGTSDATLTQAPTFGVYPNIRGVLEFDSNKIIFSHIDRSEGNVIDFVKMVDISSYNCLRISGISGKSNYNTGVAYFSLKRIVESKIDYNFDKPTVHLPLESNVTNIGYSNLTIQNLGSASFTTVKGKKCIQMSSGKFVAITANNNFNFGYNTDFYIELDFYIDALHTTGYGQVIMGNATDNQSNGGMWLQINSTQQANSGCISIAYNNNIHGVTSNSVIVGEWNKFKFYRENCSLITIELNGIKTYVRNYNIDFTVNGFTALGMIYNANNGATLDGYMSNFKMFLGTHKPPEKFNDKTVLDLDFAPTGKSYLFKDNNNKCIIHPVNITQRDFQNSTYCCSFNGTDQYLQLGKNELLNFGLDDFIIEIVFKLNKIDRTNPLLANELTTVAGRVFICVASNNKFQFGYGHSNGSQNIIIDGGTANVNEIYNMRIIRKDTTFKLIVNDEIISEITNNDQLNLNLNSNTWIGRIMNGDFLNGTIYSIKILRNTSDLSLLEEQRNIIGISEKFTLTNGEFAETIEFTELSDHDIKVVSEEDKITLSVDEEGIEFAKDDEVNNVKLFDGYIGDVKDIRVYDTPFYDNDEFIGSELIDTQLPEVEIYDDDSDEILALDYGDYIIKGFIEGGENRKYAILNKVDQFELLRGSGDYYYNGIDELYFDDYEIYEVESKQRYPLYKHEMKKGYISGTVNIANCGVERQYIKAYCYRNDNHRFIGVYELDNNNRYLIPNLDVNSKYDIIFKDQNRKIEDISSTYRTPKEY